MMRRIIAAAGMAMMLAAPVSAIAAGSSTSMDVTIGDVKRYVDRGDYDRAIDKAEEYLNSNPRSADAYNYIGYSNRQMGKYPQAQAAYDRALKIDPNHVGAHEYYGELHVKLKNFDAAEKHLADLTRICGSCSEQRQLSEAIAKGRMGS